MAEIEVLGVTGAPADAVVLVRAGHVRKQAIVSAIGKEGGSRFRFKVGGHSVNPVRIDLLRPAGSVRLALKPGMSRRYTVELKDALDGDGLPVLVSFQVLEEDHCKKQCKSEEFEAEPEAVYEKADLFDRPSKNSLSFPAYVATAKQYLDKHCLLAFNRALLQTLVREQPDEPYTFIAAQFAQAASALEKGACLADSDIFQKVEQFKASAEASALAAAAAEAEVRKLEAEMAELKSKEEASGIRAAASEVELQRLYAQVEDFKAEAEASALAVAAAEEEVRKLEAEMAELKAKDEASGIRAAASEVELQRLYVQVEEFKSAAEASALMVTSAEENLQKLEAEMGELRATVEASMFRAAASEVQLQRLEEQVADKDDALARAVDSEQKLFASAFAAKLAASEAQTRLTSSEAALRKVAAGLEVDRCNLLERLSTATSETADLSKATRDLQASLATSEAQREHFARELARKDESIESLGAKLDAMATQSRAHAASESKLQLRLVELETELQILRARAPKEAADDGSLSNEFGSRAPGSMAEATAQSELPLLPGVPKPDAVGKDAPAEAATAEECKEPAPVKEPATVAEEEQRVSCAEALRLAKEQLASFKSLMHLFDGEEPRPLSPATASLLANLEASRSILTQSQSVLRAEVSGGSRLTTPG